MIDYNEIEHKEVTAIEKTPSDICFVFVCQAGEIEIEALLLAASLRYRNPKLDGELVAAVADESLWGKISHGTRDLLNELGVRLEPISSPFGNVYPIGNKLAALAVPTPAATTVFLDSDMLCLRTFPPNQLVTGGLCAKPADFGTYGKDHKEWDKIYSFFNLALPQQRMLSTVSEETMLPYFNAGLIAVANGPFFGECWLRTAREVDANKTVKRKRPWLDQIALPVTAARLGYKLFVLDESYNYPAHVKTIDKNNLPAICHYHWPSVIQQEPALVELVATLVNKHSQLKALMINFPAWSEILNSPYITNRKLSRRWAIKRKGHRYRRDFILTGMPRSGTSLLCSLLNKAGDTVVINEPAEIFPLLHHDARAYGLDLYYRKLRADILLKKGVRSKVTAAGEIIEDTRIEDTRRCYYPVVQQPEFLLGTKNPLAYMARLRLLCDALPNIPKIVTLRHPLDCIASWKRSFPHLDQVDLQKFPFAGDADPLLDASQRAALTRIQEQTSPAVKRALLWLYLAELIWRDRNKVKIVRYEDLVQQPLRELKGVTKYLGIKTPDPASLKNVRNHRDLSVLTDEDYDAISLLCRNLLARWDYGL